MKKYHRIRGKWSWRVYLAALWVVLALGVAGRADASGPAAQPAWAPRFYAFCMETSDAKKRSLPEQVGMLRELGFDGVGYPLWVGEELDKNLRVIDDSGLKIYQLYTTINVNPNAKPYDPQIPGAIRGLKGRPATITVLLTGFPPGDPQGEEPAVKILRELGDVAAKAGLRISIYPHTGQWTESLLYALKIVKMVNRPNVGANFNLCHWLMVDGGKDYRPVLREHAGRIFAVTLNGATVGSKSWEELIRPLDQGDFDVPQLLKTLREIGYKGPIALMCYGIPGDARDHLARSIAAWRRLRASLDGEKGMELTFNAVGKEYRFDTGALRGTLRPDGRSWGLSPLVDNASSTTISGTLGLFSPYRLLDAGTRYLPDGRDWISTAQLLRDGAVKVSWQADQNHPFDMTAVYRWVSSLTLDFSIQVTPRRDLRRFEVFLASYFERFPAAFVCAGDGKPGFVEARESVAYWQAFPRDDAAAAIIADGRWQRPPSEVEWKPVARYAAPLGMRRDAKSGLVALVMAPPADCFAVSTPFGQEAHRSLYLSLFGHDLKAGETATARSRLVIAHGITDEQAIALYKAYLKETGGRRAEPAKPARQ